MWNESNIRCYSSDATKGFKMQAGERAEELPYLVPGFILSSFGIVANFHVIIALLVFLEDKNMSFTIYLRFISFSDLISCIGMLSKLFFEHYSCPLFYERETLCSVTNFFGYVCSLWSFWLVMAISYDRYRHICKPLQTQHSSKKTWIICGLSALLSLVSAIPVLFIYGKRSGRIDGEIDIIECGISDDVRNTYFPAVYYIICDVIFFILLLSVTFLYIKIRKTVIVGVEHRRQLELAGRTAAARFQMSTSERSNADGNEEAEMNLDNQNAQEKSSKLTRIAILIIVFYFISCSTVMSIETYNSFSGNAKDISRSTFLLNRYGYYGVFLNNIVNPFIYVFNHSKLRSGIKKMYMRIICR